MKLSPSSSNAAAASMLFSVVALLSPLKNALHVVAFAPTTTRHVKGTEQLDRSVLHLSTLAPEMKMTKSTTAKPQSKQRKQKPINLKGKKGVPVKKAPKRRKESQGKNKSSSIKAFRPLKDLKLGSKVSGKVIDVTDWGAFVNIGYATRGSRSGTALLHISQIQDKKIDNIRDIIKIGDNIEGARVINIDLKKGEVGLSLRTRRPKRRDFTKFQVGEKIDGKVDSVVPYGVFVDVGASVNALLHISRITGGAIENVRHHINEGDPVSVHVIDVDREKKTMAVSMLDKKADEYLDRRMSQRLKRFYGTAADADGAQKSSSSSDLDYFDQAIRELEEALRGREE